MAACCLCARAGVARAARDAARQPGAAGLGRLLVRSAALGVLLPGRQALCQPHAVPGEPSSSVQRAPAHAALRLHDDWERSMRRAVAQLVHAVVVDGARPAFPSHCPAPLAQLAAECMAHSPLQRPTFHEVRGTGDFTPHRPQPHTAAAQHQHPFSPLRVSCSPVPPTPLHRRASRARDCVCARAQVMSRLEGLCHELPPRISVPLAEAQAERQLLMSHISGEGHRAAPCGGPALPAAPEPRSEGRVGGLHPPRLAALRAPKIPSPGEHRHGFREAAPRQSTAFCHRSDATSTSLPTHAQATRS